MNKTVAILLAATALFAPLAAQAADLPPVKALPRAAPPPLPLFYGGSGTYCGMEAGMQQTKIGTATPAASTANIYAAGGTVGLVCGYTLAVGADRWAAFDVSLNMSNADATVATGAALVNVQRRYSVDLTAMYGAPVSVLSGLFSNAVTAFGALPAAPCAGAGCIAANVHPYILGGLHYGRTASQITDVTAPGLVMLEEKTNKLRFDLGVGALVQLTPATVWRTSARWTFGSQDKGAGFLLIPGAPINDGGTITVKTGLVYAMSGRGL